MQFPFYILIGLLCVLVLVAVIWRLFSNRRSIPCPSWLGWMVEMDNPILKNNSAREIFRTWIFSPG